MPDDQRPNVLYVMADDHAVNAVGAYGSRLSRIAPTDSVDRLADEGVRLDACCCANAICTPSRATILTGQHSHVNGVRTLDDGLDPDREHLAHRLRDAGYRTGVVGKWHLREEPSGFDHYEVLPGQGDYHDPVLRGADSDWEDPDTWTRHEGYSADVISDRALDWLRDGAGDDPFFLQCHFKAPHEPWEYPERHADLFADVRVPEPSSLFEDKSHRSSATRERGSTLSPRHPERSMFDDLSRADWPTGSLEAAGAGFEEQTRAAYQKYLREYLRAVAAVDENVGRLLSYLDEAGLTEDTLVVYTSDQGMFLGEHDAIDKRWIFEESLRMPFLARYPGAIPADSVAGDLVANLDFAPTILDYAGVAVPDRMQGRSARSVLEGEGGDREALYYRYWMHRAHHDVPAHYGLRTERYKLVCYYGLPLDAAGAREEPSAPGWELYDLRRDPRELENVYADPGYAAVRERLHERLAERKRAVGDDDADYPAVRERAAATRADDPD